MAPTFRTQARLRKTFEPEVLQKQKIQILGEKLFGALANLGGKKKDNCPPVSIRAKIFEPTQDESEADEQELTESQRFTSENSCFVSSSSYKEEVDNCVSLFNTQLNERITLDNTKSNATEEVETILQPTESFGSTSEMVNDISANSKEKLTPAFSSPLDINNFKEGFSKLLRREDCQANLMSNRSYFALPSMTSRIIDERNKALFERLTPVFNNSIIDQIFDNKELLNNSIGSNDNNQNVNSNCEIFPNNAVDFINKSEPNTRRVENIQSEDGVQNYIDPLTSKLYQIDYGRKTIKQINVDVLERNHQGNVKIKETNSLDKVTSNQHNRNSESRTELSKSISSINTMDTEKSMKLLHSIKSSISRNRIFVRKKSVRQNLQHYMPMVKSYVNKQVGVDCTHPEPFHSAQYSKQIQTLSPIVRPEKYEMRFVSTIKSTNPDSQNVEATLEQKNISLCPLSTHKEDGRSSSNTAKILFQGKKERRKAKKTNSILQKGSNSDMVQGNNKTEKHKLLKRNKVLRIQSLRSRKTSLISPNKIVTSDFFNCKKSTAKKKNYKNVETRIYTPRCIKTKNTLNTSKASNRRHKPIHDENINSNHSPCVSGSMVPNRMSQHNLSPTGGDRSLFPHKALGRFRTTNQRPKNNNGRIRTSSLTKTYRPREIHRDVSKSGSSKDRESRTLLPIQKRIVKRNALRRTKSQTHKISIEDSSYYRRRPATASTQKSPPRKRNSNTNVKYSEKQIDTNTPNCNPRILNTTDIESQSQPNPCLSKKKKFKSRTRSFVSYQVSPHVNQTLEKCITKRKSRRCTFLESRRDLSYDTDEDNTLRSTISLNSVSIRSNDLTQKSTSPLFNTQQNVVLDDSIFFTYREPVIKSNSHNEKRIENASCASTPLTINSLYFTIDRHKGINYISDICIDELLPPSKSLIIKEIKDENDRKLHPPHQKTISASKANPHITKYEISSIDRVHKLKEHDSKKLTAGAKISSINEKKDKTASTLPAVANNLHESRVKKVTESKHIDRGKNRSISPVRAHTTTKVKTINEKYKGNAYSSEETSVKDTRGNNIPKLLKQTNEYKNFKKKSSSEEVSNPQKNVTTIHENNNKKFKFHVLKEKKNTASILGEFNKSSGDENINAFTQGIVVDETKYKCSLKSFSDAINNLSKNIKKTDIPCVSKSAIEGDQDEKKVESTDAESNIDSKINDIKELQELSPIQIDQINNKDNESSLLENNDDFLNKVETESTPVISPMYKSILKKGTNDWTNITSSPECDTFPTESPAIREENTLSDGLNIRKQTLTVRSFENLKSFIHKQDSKWSLKTTRPINSHQNPSVITDYCMEEWMKRAPMSISKSYNFFIHSTPVTVLSDSNISVSSDKAPCVRRITSNAELVRSFSLSQPSNIHKKKIASFGEKFTPSTNPIVNSNSNVLKNKESGKVFLSSKYTVPSIEKLKHVTSRKTVSFKIPLNERASVVDIPSIHFPQPQDHSPNNYLPNVDANHEHHTNNSMEKPSLECHETHMSQSPELTSETSPALRSSPIKRSNTPNELKAINKLTVKTVLKKNLYSPYIRQIRKRKSKVMHKYGRSFSSHAPVWLTSTSEPTCSTSWIDIRSETQSSKEEQSTETPKEKHNSPLRKSSYDNINSSPKQPSKTTRDALSGKRNATSALRSDTNRPPSRALCDSRRGIDSLDPRGSAKSPTRLSNPVNSSQETTGKTQNDHCHGKNHSVNHSESVGESRPNKRHAKEVCLKSNLKLCSGAPHLESFKNNESGISDAVWEEYKKLSCTISKPLRDAIFKECGLEPPFSENNIGDNRLRDKKSSSITPSTSPQNLRAIGYDKSLATRDVSYAGKGNSGHKTIIFSGHPIGADQKGHQPLLSKQKTSQDDPQRKKNRFIDGRQYELSMELQNLTQESKHRAAHYYDSFEIPVLAPTISH